MNKLEKNLRFLTGTTVGNSNFLFSINYYRKSFQEKIIRPDCHWCIEGFQRSGNSFFIFLIRRKNKGLKLAHHTHAAAQIVKAVKYKVPTIVLIRKPEDAIASLLAWDPNLSFGIALKAYIQFHKGIRKYIQDVLLVAFEDVISKPVDVVKACNDRFNTTFELPIFNERQLEKIKINVTARNPLTAGLLPTPEKEEAKAIHKVEIERHPKYLDALALYQDLYTHRHQF